MNWNFRKRTKKFAQKQNISADTITSTIRTDSHPSAQVAAFFDVDQTLVRGATATHLAKHLYRRGFISMSDIIAALWQSFLFFLLGESHRRTEAIKKRALRALAGHREEEVREVGNVAFNELYLTRVYPGAKALVAAHKAAGHEVWLVTAVPAQIADILASRLEVTGALATIPEVKNGVFTGNLSGPIVQGKDKARAARELAHKRDFKLKYCYAYGDSENDIPLLSSVGNPYAINPEPRLRVFATSRSWPILDFRYNKFNLRRVTKHSSAMRWASILVSIATLIRRITK